RRRHPRNDPLPPVEARRTLSMDYIAVLLPPIVVGLLFWFAMKSIFNADKSERQAEARAHAEAEARAEAQNREQDSGALGG
ncbi:hypothetical protein, partial [Streptomyces sp. NPDC002082]|uniref:hypothetical protein n=2 Tax=Actinomycetes TaxID=1760 RepID=UPI00331670BA